MKELTNKMEKRENFMHFITGAIDTQEGWIDCISDVELDLASEEYKRDFDSKEDLFEFYVAERCLIYLDEEE